MKPTPFQEQSADTFLNQTKIFWLQPRAIIGLVVLIYLAIGLIVVNQYGESVDEPPRIAYAKQSIHAYSGGSTDLQDEKGPFYGMIAYQGARILDQLIPGWKFIDGWNYFSFFAFAIGVFFFYRLCRRFLNPIPTIASTLLFGTQPILWGHAFINPKDIPFMSFFLASTCLGLEMVDHWRALSNNAGERLTIKNELALLRQRLPKEWASAGRQMRRLLIILFTILAIVLASYPLMRILINWAVIQVYEAPVTSGVGQIFQKMAESAGTVQVEAYISKAQTIYSYWVLIACIGLLVGIFFISKRIFPTLINGSMQSHLLLAGSFLGFASDIRTLGPASGLFVGLYFLYQGRRKIIPYILEYLAIGAVVIYIFWPNLWRNPINGYLNSLSEASAFPFPGPITFAGNSYKPENLPGTYLPTLFGLQLTEPALILILLGFILACILLIKKSAMRVDFLLIFAWLFGPIAAAILLKSTIYDNFRQFLFIVPALFIFAGVAIQLFWIQIKGKLAIFIPFMLLILLPGLYWNWQLHPYQYIYYNTLAGGEATAAQNYEMDYWFTTYKEGAEFVNQVAPENSIVYFWNSYATAQPYIRSDLTLITDENLESLPDSGTIYAVIAAHFPPSHNIFERSKIVYEIIRGGAVLATVKEVDLADYPRNK